MTTIPMNYNYFIVILSILIAIFASFTTIELIGIARTSLRVKKKNLILLAAITMGLGIWSMHFTGMIASGIGDYNLRINLIATILSLVVAVVGSLIAFRIVLWKKSNISFMSISSILMGLSIASMHYIGMYAVHYDLYMEHDISIVLLSILIAISGAFAAIYVFSKVPDKYLYIYQLPIAIILGLAISLMHYVAMESYTLYNVPHQHTTIFYDITFSIDTSVMLNTLIVVYLIIFIITIAIALRNKQLQYQMYEMAFHDPVTKLPNRYLLEHHFQRLMQKNTTKKEKFAIFFLDLDDFKMVNDQYGHEVGDRLLQKIAEILTDTLTDRVLVSRHGGDEFIILSKKTDKQMAEKLAEKIRSSFDKPIIIDGNMIAISFSVGISLYPDNGLDIETLIKQADQAMYIAKAEGKSKFQLAKG
ncbi:diguanylate cyclase domain-containing protein [Gracilibacillus massiliensis]|uniref:diguanylate cyclase domain-containing protein n=1 Tax=Gracilibacillus massiliensis TaxID=1564956 RepID=UPI00071CBDDA|nr:diguanylate cyclase [Gracilibacillus massiliensis]